MNAPSDSATTSCRQITRESPSRNCVSNLYLAIRRPILEGELRPGSLLPPAASWPTRSAAAAARWYVYEQLREGGVPADRVVPAPVSRMHCPNPAADGPGAARRPGSNLVLSARGRIAGNATSSRIRAAPSSRSTGRRPVPLRDLASPPVEEEYPLRATSPRTLQPWGYGPLKVALSEHLKACA